MVDDLLLDEEDTLKREERRRKMTIIMGLFTLSVIAGALIWDWAAPLPNLEVCEAQGFEAGQQHGSVITCYSSCSTNEISSCRRMQVLSW